MMKACPKCTGVISESAYFGAWMCDKCDYKKSFRIGNLDKRDSRNAELEAENKELRELLRVAIGNWCDGCDWEECGVSCSYYIGKRLLEGADKEEVLDG